MQCKIFMREKRGGTGINYFILSKNFFLPFPPFIFIPKFLLNLTEDQILTLAPDEPSKKSGRDLANPSKWVSKGANNEALWGECQGSGSKPYQTQIDIVNTAFKCSCPSRKFPCKHGLGLLLLYARQRNTFTNTEVPVWVTEWLNKRAEKQEKKASKEDKPVDEEAQAKRQQARLQKVNDGINELRLWIKDIIRNGILSVPDKGFAWFENMAKRMVDAQAPGLAGMIRNLGEINFYTEGWQSLFLDQLLSIYLITEGFRNSELLNDKLQHDVKGLVGFTQSQDELKEQEGITDTWLVLAKQINEVDNITTEKYWLYGAHTNQYALILQFIVRGGLAAGQLSITPGQYIQAELVYYPSAKPLRAIIKKQTASSPMHTHAGFDNWLQVAAEETGIVSLLPVRSERACLVKQLKPVQYNKQWWLQDVQHNMVQMKNEYRYIWKLLSLSNGNAMDMVVIGKEGLYELAGVWHEGQYKIL